MYSYQNSLWLVIIIAFINSQCSTSDKKGLVIEAKEIDAVLKDSVLEGPSVFSDPDRFVWGASVIKGKDGRYHMLYATWPSGDSIERFSDSWVLHSSIAYAVSNKPDRDFQFQKVVLRGRKYEKDSLAWDADMVTNPHIKRFNDRYYLYYVGSKDPGKPEKDMPGHSLNKRNRIQQSQQIGLISFANFDDLKNGNWVRPDAPILKARTRVKQDRIIDPSPEEIKAKPDNIIVTNPSVVQRPSDGKFLLYFKGNIYDPHWKGIHGVALADYPDGPFHATDKVMFEVLLQDGKLASTEDPYVWFHHGKGCFFSVVKDFSGKVTGDKPGLALLRSENGMDWKPADHPHFMKKNVALKSTDTIQLQRLERPQLLVDENGEPRVLFAAASVVNINPRNDGKSFNVHIPLSNTEKP